MIDPAVSLVSSAVANNDGWEDLGEQQGQHTVREEVKAR